MYRQVSVSINIKPVPNKGNSILYFTLQLLLSVFKHNCGIKKFEKIMVNKYKCIEYTT
jgi:hypothetical protein